VPDVVIIAGPNGAGKTTFAGEYLPARQKRLVFVNADEIGRDAESKGEFFNDNIKDSLVHAAVTSRVKR
jgi:predicted ABC-type ATPase